MIFIIIFFNMNIVFSQKYEKTALILIETQNEWMHSEGKLKKLLITDEQMMKTQ